MKMAIDKKIVAFLLALALCAALTQPILAYMGGELPEYAGVEEDYATSGICVVFGGTGEESDGAINEASVYNNTFRLAYSGRGWSYSDWNRDLQYEDLSELMFELCDEYGNLKGFTAVVIDAETGMCKDDCYPLMFLRDFLPDITSLTINGLTRVEENAFSHEESWIESISLPDVQSVGTEAFMDCDLLVSISLPKVTSIGSRAFYGTGLQELYLEDIDIIEFGKNVVSQYKPDNPLTVYYTSGDWSRFSLAEQALHVNPVKIENSGESSSGSDDSSSEAPGPEDSSSEASEPEYSSSEASEPEDLSSEASEPEDSSSEASGPEDSSSETSEPEDSSSETSGPEDSSSETSEPGDSSSDASRPEDSSSELSEPDVSQPEASSSQAPYKPSSSKPAKTAPTEPAAVDAGEITQAVQAIAAANGDAAVENGGDSIKNPVILRFQNKSYISLSQLREITRASAKAGVNVTVHADTKVGNTVVNRLYIDPAKASRGIRLMTGEGATPVLRRFELYTENTLAVLSLGQQDNFGMKVGVAFKLPLPDGVDEKKLAIYSFNPETGKYKRIFVPNKRVEPGYLWLKTDRAGFIVVSDGTLKRSR